ncbi:MAG: TolC family protein [Gammaproteobacteria bacterium]
MPGLQAPSTRLTIVLTASIVFSGCAVGPNYTPPHPQMAASFRAAGQPATGHCAATDLASWWRAFGDPMLDKVVEQALAENFDLAQAVARVRQARAAAGIARAALLPSGELNASAATAHQSVETPIGRIEQAFGVDRNGNLYEANAGASWEVDIFGGLRRGRQGALADYQAADAGAGNCARRRGRGSGRHLHPAPHAAGAIGDCA